MIATSMALLSTGAESDKQTAILHSGLDAEASEEREATVQILDTNLLVNSARYLLDQQQPDSCNPIGNFSPVYSPLSTASADSGFQCGLGEGGLTSPANDTFLAELFGSDFPLLSSEPSSYAPNGSLVSTAGTNAPVVSSVHCQKPMLALSERQTTGAVDAKLPLDESLNDRNRKNAEAARQNRLKKKRYLEELEKDHSEVKRENVLLKTKCHEYQQRCQRLQAEVEYLKSVIANESMLSSLIQNIPNVPNVKLSSSFSSRKRPHTMDSKESTPTSKRAKTKESTSGGVCLHVAKEVVSIEFCQHCSKQAMES